MLWGDVELEPEGAGWYELLGEDQQARAAFHIDRLAEMGPLLGEPYSKQLGGKLRELRFFLGSRAMKKCMNDHGTGGDGE